MHTLSVVNYFLANALIGILFFGIVLNLMHKPKTVHRDFLINMLFYWGLLFIGVLIKYTHDGFHLTIANGVANMQLLLLGIPSFISIIAYPAVTLHPRLLRFKRYVFALLPIVVVPILYFAWHIANGVDPFYEYETISILFQNIGTIPVILRLSLTVIFLLYIVVSLLTLWRIIPLYDDYISGNLSDNSYNVDWLRRFIIYVIGVSVAYFVMLFSNSLYVNLYYICSVLALFCYILNRTLFARTFESIEPLHIKWSRTFGWHRYDPDTGIPDVAPSADRMLVMGMQLDSWMKQTEMYIRVDFTTNDILEAFPRLTNNELSQLFKERGESFQTYVRKFRIDKACEIIRQQSDTVCIKQLYEKVGFSHYSSFSRSFQGVMGKSPSEYMKEVLLAQAAEKDRITPPESGEYGETEEDKIETPFTQNTSP